MGLLQRLFGRPDRGAAPALYAAVVERARAPHWYETGRVPDTLDGRFDMIAALLALVLLRLEQDDAQAPPGPALAAALAECFIEDMDGQLREIGIGDVVVGKHIGRMMGMLGGRLAAFRDGLARGSLADALARNLYRGQAPDAGALGHVEGAMLALRQMLDEVPVARLAAGQLPA